MDSCVDLAREVGERIGRELHIPIFLYERAAPTPERINLEAIRRGGLDGLRSRMDTDATWAPDYGPACLHPTAGATVVGARPPLIAFNVNLQAEDVGIAKSIAQAGVLQTAACRMSKRWVSHYPVGVSFKSP